MLRDGGAVSDSPRCPAHRLPHSDQFRPIQSIDPSIILVYTLDYRARKGHLAEVLPTIKPLLRDAFKTSTSEPRLFFLVQTTNFQLSETMATIIL